MTDGTTGPSGDRPLTPAEEQRVAQLLADLAATDGDAPMPDHVAERLSDVLADLQRERSAEGPAQVVALRARRRWPRLMVAAAAVVVGGYAVGAVATQGTLSGSEDSLSAGDAGSSATGDSLVRGQDDGSSAEDAPGGDPDGRTGLEEKELADLAAPQADGLPSTAGTLVRIRPARLEAGVRRALRVLERDAADTTSDDRVPPGCSAPALGDGERLLTVRYDGLPAVLVAGPERRGSVEVTIWSCAGEELDSTVVRP